jgi:hypothetical protein
VEKFFRDIQSVFKAKDAARLATMVRYPITVYENGRPKGKQLVVSSEEDFVRKYRLIVYPQLEEVVSNADTSTLSGHAEGVMVGRGHLWIGKVCEDPSCTKYAVKVITINPAIPSGL